MFKKVLNYLLFAFKYRWWLGENHISFYFRVLIKQYKNAIKGIGNPSVNYYEFGVGKGETMIRFLTALKTFCRIYKKDFNSFHIFGFDTFEGLPEKENYRDDLRLWKKGLFSHDIIEITKLMKKLGFDMNKKNIHLIKGNYKKTLTPSLRDEFSKFPPAIVTIDCDYYSSTLRVLQWLKPMLSSGTIFYFDDIWNFHGHSDYGELGAINEFNKAGEGKLIPFPRLGMSGLVYIFSKKEFEFTTGRFNQRIL